MNINRRQVIRGGVGLGALALAAPAVIGQAKPRAVVIGGGPGGATAAKYIAKDSQGAIDVVLVEPTREFTTCFHSNLYLGGYRDFASITHGYDKLVPYGVRLNHQFANTIDRDKKEVVLADGSRLPYDRLVVSPGIDLKYDSVPGWGQEFEETMPHAWKAGPQTQLLKRRLDAVPDGGLIVMVAPPNPYRCPPGPYERASMMLHVLKSTGRSKAKIIIVDPKENFSKQALFQEGWEKYYPGMIEWIGPKIHDGIKSVDPKTNTVVTGFETYKDAALVNVIPAQTAGKIARDAGLANQTGFCPINPENMKSAQDANIFILGDACIAGDMPKSAFSANSQAKVAAMMVRGDLTGARTFPARYANTCWSLIETDDAVKVGGAYEPKDGKIAAASTFISQTGEMADLRKQTQAENMAWYSAFVADVFA
ncbi:NAD(P)/FAD-dependent oxidoreductase [Methylocella sp. CPCC 101449]|uniref:NAD(P)/FAD-dependent oxidoreductase n=1 Tax=Methylocella sp. CPCC 101449 TaxID=2987531 RepID=UPI002890F299|nr:NAD(P)/FAD-dependent oxidoreductase [Methylocella sp. CPCC 101449]MDT2021176.1 NAD(P)/FAD-dependent oxidoreductase [Methylocella sp. CPCC 101449]